jgi:hypothetical protein
MPQMAVEPEFFSRRRSAALVDDPALGLASEALLAAAEAALTRPAPTEAGLRRALRRLRDVEAAAPEEALESLAPPRDLDEMRACLARPCATWLPLAAELGVGHERLLTLGFPSVACRDVQLRYG